MMDRRKRRLERRLKKEEEIRTVVDGADIEQPGRDVKTSDDKFAKLLTQKEDVLLNFVAKINKLYQVSSSRCIMQTLYEW
jgi:hypothetical protein